MNKPSKCKNCQWYGKPYWSIINPCDNCPMENVETVTHWVDPTIKELQNEIERLNKEHKKTIDMAIHFINLHQDSKTLSLDYFDLKKLRGLLNNDKFYIKLFKDELKELKEEGKKDE